MGGGAFCCYLVIMGWGVGVVVYYHHAEGYLRAAVAHQPTKLHYVCHCGVQPCTMAGPVSPVAILIWHQLGVEEV